MYGQDHSSETKIRSLLIFNNHSGVINPRKEYNKCLIPPLRPTHRICFFKTKKDSKLVFLFWELDSRRPKPWLPQGGIFAASAALAFYFLANLLFCSEWCREGLARGVARLRVGLRFALAGYSITKYGRGMKAALILCKLNIPTPIFQNRLYAPLPF